MPQKSAPQESLPSSRAQYPCWEALRWSHPHTYEALKQSAVRRGSQGPATEGLQIFTEVGGSASSSKEVAPSGKEVVPSGKEEKRHKRRHRRSSSSSNARESRSSSRAKGQSDAESVARSMPSGLPDIVQESPARKSRSRRPSSRGSEPGQPIAAANDLGDSIRRSNDRSLVKSKSAPTLKPMKDVEFWCCSCNPLLSNIRLNDPPLLDDPVENPQHKARRGFTRTPQGTYFSFSIGSAA